MNSPQNSLNTDIDLLKEISRNPDLRENIFKKIDLFIYNNSAKIDSFLDIQAFEYARELLTESGLSDRVVNLIWNKQFPNWPKQYVLYNNPIAKGLLILAYIIYNKSKSLEDLNIILSLYAFVIYKSIMFKYFKTGIDTSIAYQAIDSLSGNHSFKKFQYRISAAIIQMVRDVVNNQHQRFVPPPDQQNWLRIMLDIRVRINQSVKSFAVKYYSIFQDMQVKQNSADREDSTIAIGNVVEIIVNKIIFNSYQSKSSLDITLKMTMVSKSVITRVINNLNHTELKEELEGYYRSFILYFHEKKILDQLFNEEIALDVIKKLILAKNVGKLHPRSYTKILLDMTAKLDSTLEKQYNSYSNRTKTFMELSIMVYLYFTMKDILKM